MKNYDGTHIGVYVNGDSQPARPMRLQFKGKSAFGANYVEALLSIYQGTGKLGHDISVSIDRDDYQAGYAFYVFDLDNGSDNTHFWSLLKEGNMRLEIQFDTSLPKTVSLIVNGEMPYCLEID